MNIIFILLLIASALTLFLMPILMISMFTGRLKIKQIELDFSNINSTTRAVLAVVGGIAWLTGFIPLAVLATGSFSDLSSPGGFMAGEPASPTASLPTETPPPSLTAVPPSPTIPFTPTHTLPPSLTPTTTVTPGPSPTVIPYEMVVVPAGSFFMGSSYTDAYDFDPGHLVYLDKFYIDQYEVTNAQYAQCVTARACEPPAFFGSNTRLRYYDNLEEYGDYPVVFVTWDQARTYCEWRGDRLPTEAEWEKAAGWNPFNEKTAYYPWGDRDPTLDLVHFQAEDTAPVGSYPEGASKVDALDMAGNVMEWVADTYSPTYYQFSPARNPSGPTSQEGDKVLRGGGYSDIYKAVLWTFWRYHLPADTADDYIGFRCASDTAP